MPYIIDVDNSFLGNGVGLWDSPTLIIRTFLDILFYPMLPCTRYYWNKKGQMEHHAWQFLPPFSVILVAQPIGHRLYFAMHAANLYKPKGGKTQTQPLDCSSTITCSNSVTASSAKLVKAALAPSIKLPISSLATGR